MHDEKISFFFLFAKNVVLLEVVSKDRNTD